MAVFNYKARSDSGKQVEGEMEAENSRTVAKRLNEQNLIPVSISQQAIKEDLLAGFNHWLALNQLNLDDLMLFSRQMYSLNKAGVPIIRAIHSLINSTRNKALSQALSDIVSSLEAGQPLSQAMGKHPKVFSNLFISIVHVGEATGGLDQAFLQMSHYLEREKETQSRIKSALRYPTMVIIAISIAMAVVNIYVIPAFKTVFDKIDADLPWQTKLLMEISDFSVTYWPHILIFLIIVYFTLLQYIQSPQGEMKKDRFLLKIPAVGSIIHRATMERFSRSFAMILSSGVPLIQGINIVSDAIGNVYIGSKLDAMRIGIEKGDSISRMAMSVGLFPPLVIQMIMVGEETGNISDMLLEVADFYQSEIDSELKNLASIIEPFLIVIIGIMVLVLALGIFLPMWNLSSSIN